MEMGGFETAERYINDSMIARTAEFIIKTHSQDRLKEADFNDLYQPDEIKNDQRMAGRMKEEFEDKKLFLSKNEIIKIKERKNTAEAMEIVITESEVYDWFGPNAHIIRTTEYDDIFNGVDAVIEFNDETGHERHQHVALVIDITTAGDSKFLEAKIDKNIKSLTGKSEKKKRVKYFESPITGEQQSLDTIIPVVIGLDEHNSQELLATFAQIKKLSAKEGKNENERNLIMDLKKEMAEHPAQVVFLKEITMQLEHYQSLFKIDQKTGEEIQNILSIIYEVVLDKKNIDCAQIEGTDQCLKNMKNILNL